ncbi:MAG: hypothetical protein MJZ06_06835 [Bacteroidaceae bacterium]|nr:hypothetical protein [Bacteroidaceae bacterium]
MKKINSQTRRSGLKGLALLAMAATFGVSSCTTDFDLDKRTPEWLGTSIFETLDKGFEGENGKIYHFENFVRLIQDLDQEKILAKTGSKTLFVADDDAFARFFGPDCPFKKADGTPVTCYDELSIAQKTMILKGSMLNNVYQVAMLSSSEGPTIGDCMRRLSSSSIYDTIPVLKQEDMPDTDLWRYYKNSPERKDGMAIMQDGTIRPMIFFVNKFLTSKKITDDDYDFLFNQGAYGTKPARQPADASVNGVRIEFQNKKCFNGFLHVMEEVVYLLPNMAEYLESDKENAVIYSRIVDRFCAPFFPSKEHTNQITRLVEDGKVYVPESALDSVFTKQYFSKRSQGDTKVNTLPMSTKKFGMDGELLKFDPGWNQYFSQTSSNTETNIALQQNMGVMLVPTDKAMTEWWIAGGGKALRDRYGKAQFKGRTDLSPAEVALDMDSIPLVVIVKLLNNNMLNSLVASVPSKFANVLNDANDPMDLKAESVDSVVMCCNGAIYFTNTVYAPTAYRSVSYPALVNENLSVINWAIEDETLSFSAYLNSMVATYSFFIPTITDVPGTDVEGKLVWLDPTSFAINKMGSGTAEEDNYLQATVFGYDNVKKTVTAKVYRYDIETGSIYGDYTSEITSEDIIRDRLEDILDYHIIIGDVEDSSLADENGYSYFQTKGRGTIRFKNASDFHNMEVAGGYQIETGEKINIIDRFDLTANGNGRTYIIDKPLLTSRKSVYDILSDSVTYPEFKSFFKLMNKALGKDGKALFDSRSNGNDIGSRFNVTTFNTYHYTVYVPQNDAIDKLLKDHVLYDPSELAAIDSLWTDVLENLQAIDPLTADSIFADSLAAYHERLMVQDPSAEAQAELKTYADVKKYTDAKREKLRNFIKYHIQDNAVYANASFNAGYDEQGNKALSANYETAFMNDKQQFVKLNVRGGKDIQVTDVMGNVRHVLKQKSETSQAPLYNIMCREYEYKVGTSSDPVTSVTTAVIETSSYAVIHLIDGALCNGEVIF